MAARLTEGGLWGLSGYPGETDPDVELFPGVGFFSRPREGAENVEVIVLKLAENHPVIVATRDEDTRVELDHDETAIFTSQSIVKIKQDGTIEIGSIGGTFKSLATLDDLQTVRDEVHDHEHLYVPALHPAVPPTPVSTTGGPTVTSPTGTTKLKGE